MNTILLRSNHMAQLPQRPTRQSISVLFDKGRRFLRNSPPTTPQKRFKKSSDARRDLSVLAMTYIMQENPTIQELIRLIVGLDHDNSKLSEVIALSATFTIQLASFHEEDSSKALAAITAFLTTMRNIDTMSRDGTKTTNDINNMMNDSIKQIKSTHPRLGDHDRNIGGDKGLSSILNTIIGTTSTILIVFNGASGAIPVPYVKPLVAGVASLLTAVQQTRSNLDDMRLLVTVAGEFVVMLAVACASDEMKPSPHFRQALNRFEKKLYDIAHVCGELSHRNVLWRFFQQGVDQNSLSGLTQDMQNAVEQFQTEAQLLQHLDLRSLGQVINGKLDVDTVNTLPKPLSYVGRRNQYLPGSRSDVIQVIADWLENSDQLAFWMRGGAGLGKSTLAHEIVDSLQADGRLATFAFLLRGSSSDTTTVIQTMARELGALHSRAIPEIAAAARTCNASHRHLREYMESYIINPIRCLSYPYPLVIVVDGLDEWVHHEAFLEELAHIPQPSPVKILLFSRPNHSIERSLLKVATKKYDLPPVSRAITEMYFNHHFEQIDWKMRKPSQFVISDLARLADGLLIWAAMVCSFLSYEMRTGAPHELVEQILSSGKQIALEGQLSNLYYDAMKQLFRDDKEQKLFQQVFGAMTVLQESLSLHDFARLLGLSDDQVGGVQSRLTALQTRGTFDEHTVPPASERFHSSFLEFTLNREAEACNSLIPYPINPRTAHESVAEGCLNFLKNFLSSFRGSKCIHSDLRGLELYTVKFWPLHLANSNDRLTPLPPKLENLILELPENHLRQWGSWFLAISLPASSQNWDQVVGCIDKDGFYCSLASFLQNDMTMDTTLESRRTFFLEIAIRSQPTHEKAWEYLGDSYRTRFDRAGTLDLLNNAINVYCHALKLCSKDGSHLTCMTSLASALWCRFRRTSSITDLEEAIIMDRESLSLRPTPHPDRDISLTNLGIGLWERFQRTGTMADLEEAIVMHRESLSLCPISHLGRSSSLTNLGLALSERFRKTRSMTDLDEAILLLRESLHLTPGTDRSIDLNNLAIALWDRFAMTRSMIDLDEAILMLRESLSLRPAPHPDRSSSLNNLASALWDRFSKTGLMTDLEEVVLMHRESLFLRPIPHSHRSDSLYNLANALGDRFRKTDSMTYLDEAISMYHESLSLRPAPHPGRRQVLENLASALETRFKENGVQSDLLEATSLRQELEILTMS